MKKLLVWILVLSLFDAVVTDFGIQAGYIREVNPLMKAIYLWSPPFFYACKLFPPLLLMWIYPRLKPRNIINGGILLCFITYTTIALYHITWMIIILKRLSA